MTAPFVLDTSAALAWLLKTQRTAAAVAFVEELAETDRPLVAPSCFRWEIRHVLVKHERRGAIFAHDVDPELAALESRMQIELDGEEFSLLSRLAAIKTLAAQVGLSMLDAAYLELTTRCAGELTSRDGRLLEAAAKFGCAIRDLR